MRTTITIPYRAEADEPSLDPEWAAIEVEGLARHLWF